MTTKARQVVREQIAIALKSYMSSAYIVYDYKTDDLEGYPAVIVVSSGSQRVPFGRETRLRVFLEIHLMVPYSDVDAGWTPENADDALDNLEYEFAKFVNDHEPSQYWKSIDYVDRSYITRALVGGREYQDEVILISVEVY